MPPPMDPRLANRVVSDPNGAHKRRLSEHASDHERQKIPRLEDRRYQSDGPNMPARGVGAFRSTSSGNASPMNGTMGSPLSRPDNESSSKSINAIMDLLKEHARSVSKVVKQEIVTDHAETRLAQAKKDYDSVANHFDGFPHMREKQTAQRNAAESVVKKEKQELSARQKVQETLTQQLAQIMFQSLQKPSQETDPELKAEIQSLKEDRRRDRETLEAMDRKIKNMEIVTGQVRHLHSVSSKTDNLLKEVGDVKKRCGEMEPTVVKTERLVVKLQEIQNERNKLNEKTNEKATREITELKSEVQTIKSSSNAAQAREKPETNDILRQQVQEVESTLGGIASRLGKAEESITLISNMIPETHVIVGDQIEAIDANSKKEIADIRKALEEFKIPEKLASDTTQFVDSVKEVENKIDTIQREITYFKSSNREVINSMGKDFENKLNTKADRKDLAKVIEKQPSSTPQPQFVAPAVGIPNGVSNQNGGPVNGPIQLQDVMNKIDQLSHWLNRLQNQYNNLTTEQVVAQMMSQIGQIYPDVKNLAQAQAALTTLRHDLDALSQTVSASKTNSNADGESTNEIKRVGAEMQKMSRELDAQASIIAFGKTEIEKFRVIVGEMQRQIVSLQAETQVITTELHELD